MICRAIAASVLITCFWIAGTTAAHGQNLGKLLSDGQSISGHAHISGNAGCRRRSECAHVAGLLFL